MIEISRKCVVYSRSKQHLFALRKTETTTSRIQSQPFEIRSPSITRYMKSLPYRNSVGELRYCHLVSSLTRTFNTLQHKHRELCEHFDVELCHTMMFLTAGDNRSVCLAPTPYSSTSDLIIHLFDSLCDTK
jgi:hypothetical protein